MKRWKTREVMVGNVGVGGDNPIRIQSMTTSLTSDVEATVEQIMRLADEGCEIARVTVQGKKEAEACDAIKNSLIQKGYTIPLVADIHFYPPAALRVVEFVDKVRINPGNYIRNMSEQQTLEKIEEGFFPLIEKCKRLKRAMRIGTNHGSLSDWIMNRYGNTAKGMVVSALEFAQVCRKWDYHDFLFSMKASNPLVMIEAYRLLIQEMERLKWNYPLHLGVTEAGEGEDGRIKSAVGIGALLLDGYGDTIRVSLTEDPWEEIDPCRRLIQLADTYQDERYSLPTRERVKREDDLAILHRDGTVILPVDEEEVKTKADAILIGNTLKKLEKTFQVKTLAELDEKPSIVFAEDLDPASWKKLLSASLHFIILHLSPPILYHGRRFFDWMKQKGLDVPVILSAQYGEDETIQAAAELGALLADGYGEGICLNASLSPQERASLSFSILQACRMRATKTEFISCPGCGRTLFNIKEVTKKIRSRTSHLPGVKIAIMGCVVNGPGEMADADFGYVGSQRGKIDLYVGKACVEKGIDASHADEKLIELIKAHGLWVEN